MKVVIGGIYYPTIEAASLRIQRSATDPIPTCAFNIIDNTSSLTPQYANEVLILDDQQVPNPTINQARWPDLNPYTQWTTIGPPSGITLSQNGGGGVIFTFANTAAASPTGVLQQTVIFGQIVAGQSYIFSVSVQGASSPTNIGACIFVVWRDAGNNAISTMSFNGSVPVSTSLTQYTVSGVAPAGAVAAFLQLGYQTSSATNSGTITFTKAQMEPEWFPTLTYPTPWCGPAQLNCQQLPLGFWIRQYRKFAGFITRPTNTQYHGNVRTIQINASGYAWLTGMSYANDSFSGQTDAAIVISLANKYLANSGLLIYSIQAPLCNTTNVVTGVTTTTIQGNWDEVRSLFAGLCGLSGFYWTIDYYWNLIYAPLGYLSQPVTLICDNSSQPDNVLTFPAYEFSADTDFTQPGSTILVLGSGSNVSLVSDPAQIAQLGYASGYYLSAQTNWMRKVNDATLGSTTDTNTRGQAELLLYDMARKLYHVKTNVELIPGQSIQVTSATEGLNQSTQLVQQTTGTWLGTDETLKDRWEYQSDLGAVNRTVSHMMSRLHRQTQKGTSAPAIAANTLAAYESLALLESLGTGTAPGNYFQTVQQDSPLGLWPLGEISGSIADDISGNARQGTLNGGITVGASNLLNDSPDAGATAMTFNGSTGFISLPTALIPTGSGHAWSLEIWGKVAGLPGSGSYATLIGMGANVANQMTTIGVHNVAGTGFFTCNINGTDIQSASGLTIGTIYFIVATYDGTNVRLYVNNSLVAGPTAATTNLGTSFADIGNVNATNFFNGTLQYGGIYGVGLSSTQVSNHWNAG